MDQKYTKTLLDRFLKYVKIDTQSDPTSETFPSTQKQFTLANLLVEELKGLGLSEVHLDENCYVTATLEQNSTKKCPTIGLIAHMDTSPDMPGANVRPQIIENYDGKDILLSKTKNLYMTLKDFPFLAHYKGQTLITTSGDTLLGADNKAGIAEIITSIEYLIEHPEIKHGKVRLGFTPDEEIGKGADKFDVSAFNADFAFTIDGGEIGELEYENFNAASAEIEIHGKNVHPGTAKNVMLNSMLVAMEFNGMLPVHQSPEYTEKYEGFYHLVKMEGTVENAKIQYIVRDHDMEKFGQKKEQIRDIAAYLNKKYGDGTVNAELKDQYYNMREKIEPVYHIIELAEKAMKEAGVKPNIKPIRGGTDGARLSYMGLPCPNIFTGGHNFHGKFECIPLESMTKACDVIINVITRNAG